MAVQEHHDLPDDLLLGPGSSDAARPHRADAVHLPQAVGLGLDDVEHLLPEGAQQFLGIDRADAPDHARGKVLLDALERSRGRGGAIQTDAAYVGNSNIDRGLADGGGDTQRRGVFGNS
jgi:hypothetical protein